MIWLAAQLWPAALLALVAGFAITWFTVVRRLDDAPVSAERERRDGGSRRAERSSDGHSAVSYTHLTLPTILRV